jgi:hypothetical protein
MKFLAWFAIGIVGIVLAAAPSSTLQDLPQAHKSPPKKNIALPSWLFILRTWCK